MLYEDIGRHNAMDKVVGHALIEGVDMSRGALVTTGRLNAEMVVKALRARVPILASRSAVSTHAVELAETYGLTLVGFARGGRLNVYTRPERIEDE
jgi:FdhD protein